MGGYVGIFGGITGRMGFIKGTDGGWIGGGYIMLPTPYGIVGGGLKIGGTSEVGIGCTGCIKACGLLSIGGGGRNDRGNGSPGGGRGVRVGCFDGTASDGVVVTGAGVAASFSDNTVKFGSVIQDGSVSPRPRPAIAYEND